MRYLLAVADVMTKDVVTVAADAPFKSIVETLAEHRISGVPVRDGYGGVAGIVSETDLLHKDEGRRTWRRRTRANGGALTARQLMTSPVVTVEGGCTLDEAARLMAARRITRLVVLDGDELTGIVTGSDLLRAFTAPDEEILARVRRDIVDRQLWDDPFAVEVSVRDGVAMLTGEVEKRSTAVFAEVLIGGVDGVAGVRSTLSWLVDDTAPAPGAIFS
ncbi:CBS domain-containing protein [Kribbella sp. NPDC026611]|uniref:CBS domain-containing protein n=1 Tax=Kribbella sp. NPDC026611 TaxID=3154911 RepID=UPI003406205C